MEKLCNLLGRDKPVDGDVGLEIEAEGAGMEVMESRVWKSDDDGSLRGVFPDSRHEFILKKPIKWANVPAALDELVEAQKDAKFKFSFRTSVHVHVNAQDLTYVQLLNLIYTYVLLEQPLIDFCGDSRKANRFCLRLRDADGLIGELSNVFQDQTRLVNVPRDTMRYASINLEAFRKYGSIEFRAMRGTMDTKVILRWVNMLRRLKDYAIMAESPMKIHECLRDIGAEAFMNGVMGEYAEGLKLDGMVENYSLSLDLPYVYAAQAAKPVVEKRVVRAKLPEAPRLNPDAPRWNNPVRWDEAIPQVNGRRADVVIIDDLEHIPERDEEAL